MERILPLFGREITSQWAAEAQADAEAELKASAQQLSAEDSAAAAAAAAPPQFSSWGADAAGRPVSEWDYLNNFFKRHNKARRCRRRSRLPLRCPTLSESPHGGAAVAGELGVVQ